MSSLHVTQPPFHYKSLLIICSPQYLTKAKDQEVGTPAANSVSMANNIITEFSKNEMQTKRDKVMKQMAGMQKKFLETYKEELDQIDLGSVEEEKVHASTQHTALQCALGVAPLVSHALPPMAATCILCQEETRNVAGHEKVFVQAAQVQRSAVLRRCVKSTTDRGKGKKKWTGNMWGVVSLPRTAPFVSLFIGEGVGRKGWGWG